MSLDLILLSLLSIWALWDMWSGNYKRRQDMMDERSRREYGRFNRGA
jgi:hypothetical protein